MNWQNELTLHWGWGVVGGLLLAGLTLFFSLNQPFLVMAMFLFGVVFGAVGPKKPFFQYLWHKAAQLRSNAAA